MPVIIPSRGQTTFFSNPSSGVDGGLLRVDVIRPDGGACVLGSLGDNAAASKEIDEDWKGF